MKLKVFLIILILLLGGGIYYQYTVMEEIKADRNRIEENFINANCELDSVKTKNGEYSYTIETLTLNKYELEKTNSRLVDETKAMKIKIKNLESLAEINIDYNKKDSIVPVEKVNDTVFITKIEDDWVTNTWETSVKNNAKTIEVNNYELEVRDSILIPTEVEYKGWWIFKRPIGVRIHVKSSNPYSSIDKMKYIRLEK